MLQIHYQTYIPASDRDARLLLTLARSYRDSSKTDLSTIESKLHETELIVQYYRQQAEVARKKLLESEECVGRIRAGLELKHVPFYVETANIPAMHAAASTKCDV